MDPFDEELELLIGDDVGEGDSGVDVMAEAGAIPGPIPRPFPFPIPLLWPVSGTYSWAPFIHPIPHPTPLPIPIGPAPSGIFPIRRETIRLDVDGRYPQMAVSGTVGGFLVGRTHWIARLTRVGSSRWTGADLVQGHHAALVVRVHERRGDRDPQPVPER